MRKESLGLLEELSRKGYIDLFYGDETRISEEGYIPYGWQFKDENVAIEVQRGQAINVFGLVNRTNDFFYKMTKKNINSDFIIETLDEFSLNINKKTVIVLDNARVHKAKKVRELFDIWQNRGLFIFFLPPYSPHLNIIERLWKEMKDRWVRPGDYLSADNLFYAVDRICANIGKQLFIQFNQYTF